MTDHTKITWCGACGGEHEPGPCPPQAFSYFWCPQCACTHRIPNDACFGLAWMHCSCGKTANSWMKIPFKLYLQLHPDPNKVTATQSLIALGKYASGYRPGDEMWSELDQAALDLALGECREVIS